jgi:2'-5' RNA ligase
MFSDPSGVEYLNCFALVSYIPEPLAGFLDRLRCELVPNCFLRAHVTILPPRPIESAPEKAWTQLRDAAYRLEPIDVELSGVEIFPVSDVIYISIGKGHDELKHLHEKLNTGRLGYREPFPFHPHITLAQNLTPDQVDELSEVARRRWTEYAGPRGFRAGVVTFVQNTRWHGWIDLGETVLGRGVESEPRLALV